MSDARLCSGCQLARHDLRIDRVGDAQWIIHRDQAEIADILDVALRELKFVAAAQQRFNHAPHTVLVELIRKLVQVSLTPQNEALLHIGEIVREDPSRAIPPSFASIAGPPPKGIHKPWLALCP